MKLTSFPADAERHVSQPLPSPSPSVSPPDTTTTNAVNNAVADDSDMEVEDTPHRVYISNLAKEIAEIEAAEEAAKKLIFLPDVDKQFMDRASSIPIPVLANKDGEIGGVNREQALVLYGAPKSLSVGVDKDWGHRVIEDARERARIRQGKKPMSDLIPTEAHPAHGVVEEIMDDDVEPMAVEDDADVMDLD